MKMEDEIMVDDVIAVNQPNTIAKKENNRDDKQGVGDEEAPSVVPPQAVRDAEDLLLLKQDKQSTGDSSQRPEQGPPAISGKPHEDARNAEQALLTKVQRHSLSRPDSNRPGTNNNDPDVTPSHPHDRDPIVQQQTNNRTFNNGPPDSQPGAFFHVPAFAQENNIHDDDDDRTVRIFSDPEEGQALRTNHPHELEIDVDDWAAAQRSRTSNSYHPNGNHDRANEGLVHARAVQDHDFPPRRLELTEAQPVTDPNDVYTSTHHHTSDGNGNSNHQEIAMTKKQMEQERQHKVCVSMMSLLGLLAVIGAIVGISLGVSNSNNSSSSDSRSNESNVAENPTGSPTPAPTAFVLEGLPEYTMESILSDPGSPQARAYQWVQEDPWFGLDPEHNESLPLSRWHQRYAMAVLFYATNGNNWQVQGGNGMSFNISTTNVRPGGPPPKPPPSQASEAVCSAQRSKPPSQGTGPDSEYDVIWPERWLSYDTHECDWYSKAALRGVPRCNETGNTGYYRSMSLNENNLMGSLPKEIGMLYPTLYGLSLPINGLTGTLPSQLSQLIYLSLMDLENNGLSGQIPSELGLLTCPGIDVIRLTNNALSGTIPSDLMQLWTLRELKFGCNALTGALPNLGNLSLTNLFQYEVHENKLNGTIPTSLGQLKIKRTMWLHSNQFTGQIPSELGMLSLATSLKVNDNKLSNMLPSELGLLSSLIELDVSKNQDITGTIPNEWSHLNWSLQSLNLKDTSLTGTIPNALCNISNIEFDCNADALCGCDDLCLCNTDA